MAYLTRYTPGREFVQLRREMDRLFNDYLPTGRTGETEGEQAVWAPRADLAETTEGFVLALDVPGVQPENLHVTVEEGTLKVSGEREVAREQRDGQFHRIERSYGRFYRAFELGQAADPNKVEAAYENGVLTVRVGKAEASRPRRIEVRAGTRTEAGDGASSQPAHDIEVREGQAS
jgi:HSP20 family protein